MIWKKGLSIIADEKTSNLIMGSFPGERSLIAKEYYFDKTNDLWKILGNIYAKDFKSMHYSERIESILNEGLGLWDVYSDCQRSWGSSDRRIWGFFLNNFKDLKERWPAIEKVGLNGKVAGIYSENFSELGYETFILPSSSGANRRNQIKRLDDWINFLK